MVTVSRHRRAGRCRDEYVAARADLCLAVMFVFTGVAHFNKIKYELEKMVPTIFPKPMMMVYLTGVFELLGAIGILLPRSRSLAGFCLILLLLAMFPANVRAFREKLMVAGKPATALWLRTPMQIVFIALIWWATQPLSWMQIKIYADRKVINVISGGTPNRTGMPKVPSPRFT